MRKFSIAVVATFMLLAACANATTIAYTDTVQVGNQTVGAPYFVGLGMDFTLLNPIRVTALGAFDSGATADGTANNVYVALFNTDTQALVATAQIASGSGSGWVSGGDRFVNISPVVLQAGFHGTIVAYYSGDADCNSSIASPSCVTAGKGDTTNIQYLNGGRWIAANTSTFVAAAPIFPTTAQSGTANVYAAGTFAYDAVPEPASFALIAAGLGAIGLLGRRIRR